MKIAAVTAKAGRRVIFPIFDQYQPIRDGLHLPDGVEMPLLSQDFDLKNEYLWVATEAERAAWADDFKYHQAPFSSPNAYYVALYSSWRRAPSDTMRVKYQIAGIDPSDWADYVKIKRDLNREEDLRRHLGITDGRRFAFLNEHCRIHRTSVAMPGEVVRMSTLPGFSLFDWSGVIERASEIITIDTAVVLLVEVLKPQVRLQVLNRYDPPTFSAIAPILRLHWHFATTAKDLIT